MPNRLPSLATLYVLLTLLAGAALAGPTPPCQPGPVSPAYGPAGGVPGVATWSDVTLSLGGSCPKDLNGPAHLVVALSGRFIHTGGVESLAARVGSVSALTGLRYWSATESRWRVLIADSYAVDSAATARKRADFTPTEVLGGQSLILSQKDTRSTGRNLYALRSTSRSASHLAVVMQNLTPIRLVIATLFQPKQLVTAQFFTRLGGNEWGYYSLTVVKSGAGKGNEKSFVNRAAAVMRFLTGADPVGQPPLAP